MGRPAKREYHPQNPEKYVGTYPIISRSSWEYDFCVQCDLNPNVVQWASEPEKIPYRDPLTGNQKVYIPDFLITQVTKSKTTVTKLIEIKPMHEQLSEHARNSTDAAIQARNRAKWGAAISWCGRRGIEFVVLNESNLYVGHENKKGRVNPIHQYAPAQTKDLKPKTKKAKPAKTRIKAQAKKINRIRTKIKAANSRKTQSVSRAKRA